MGMLRCRGVLADTYRKGHRRDHSRLMTSRATYSRRAVWRPLSILAAILIVALQHASASTASMASTESCLDELEYCTLDQECDECLTSSLGDNAACVSDLAQNAADAGFTTASCEGQSLGACCGDAASSNYCLTNGYYVSYYLCVISRSSVAIGGPGDCTTITCSFDGVGGVDGSGVAGVKSFISSTTIAFALGAAFVVIPALVKSM